MAIEKDYSKEWKRIRAFQNVISRPRVGNTFLMMNGVLNTEKFKVIVLGNMQAEEIVKTYNLNGLSLRRNFVSYDSLLLEKLYGYIGPVAVDHFVLLHLMGDFQEIITGQRHDIEILKTQLRAIEGRNLTIQGRFQQIIEGVHKTVSDVVNALWLPKFVKTSLIHKIVYGIGEVFKSQLL